MFIVFCIIVAVIAVLSIGTRVMAVHYERKRLQLIADARCFNRVVEACTNHRSEFEANLSMQRK